MRKKKFSGRKAGAISWKAREDELTYNGVVYNEMKGYFLLRRTCWTDKEVQNSLYPDNTYSNELGDGIYSGSEIL